MGQRKKLTADDIMKALSDGGSYTIKELTIRFGCTDKTVRDIMIWLVGVGNVQREKVDRTNLYKLTAKQKHEGETATPKVVHRRELGVYDLAVFQRQCEAARNPDKGMV